MHRPHKHRCRLRRRLPSRPPQVSPATKAREAEDARLAKKFLDPLFNPGETQGGCAEGAAAPAAADVAAEEPAQEQPLDVDGAVMEEADEAAAAGDDDVDRAPAATAAPTEHGASYCNQETLERPLDEDADGDDMEDEEYGGADF